MLTAKANKLIREITPSAINAEIETFCGQIAKDTHPIFVPVQPVEGAAYGYCHANVPQHVQRAGGQSVPGWTIWQSPIAYHAECHCVWQDDGGSLVDITPKPDGERRILFLGDSSIVWNGKAIPSRYASRSNRREVRLFVKQQREMWNIMCRYDVGSPLAAADNDRYLRLVKANMDTLNALAEQI